MKKKFFAALGFLLMIVVLQAQTSNEKIDKIRAESGLDPTRTVTKLGTSVWVSTPEGKGTQIRQNFNFQAAVGTWNFTLQTQLFSAIKDNDRTFGWSDLEFTITDVPFSYGKHSLGLMTKFSIPTGSNGVSTDQFLITPGFVYVFAPSNSIILAVQPQYTVSAVKPDVYPMTNMLTVRIFTAAFTAKGFAGVFEVRPIYDFTNTAFNLVISPIVSFNIGKGFTINGLVEIPVMPDYWKKDSIIYKFGVQKSF